MTESTSEYWRAWLKAAAIRAVKTFAQTLAASIAVSSTLTDAPWIPALSAAGMAALLSLLTSLGGLPEVPGETRMPELFEDEEVVSDEAQRHQPQD